MRPQQRTYRESGQTWQRNKPLLHYGIALEIDKEAIFPPLGPHHSQQNHCYFLQFKIIAWNIHDDTGIKRGNGALNSHHKRMKVSLIHQPTKRTWHKTQQSKNKNENQCVYNAKDSVLAHIWGRAVSFWLRHCATNRQVAGLILDCLIEIFHWHNPSSRTTALGSTQPLTKMSTRCLSWG
jgi:hypothetical protein